MIRLAIHALVLVFLAVTTCVGQGTAATDTLNLDECIRIAFEKSPYITRIESERTQAAWQVLRTISPVLPHAAVTSSASRSGPDRGISIVEIPGTPGTVGSLPIVSEELARNEYATTVALSQSLVDVPVWIQIRQSLRARETALAAYRGAQAEFAFSIKQAYYRLVQLNLRFRIAASAVAQSEEQMRLAQARFELEALSRPELLRVETGLAQQRIDLIDAATELEAGRRELANLLGVSGPIRIDTAIAPPDPRDSVPTRDSLLGLALRRNLSLLTAQATVQARSTDRRAVLLDKVPTADMTFTYGSADDSFAEQFSEWGNNDFWRLAAYVRLSLANVGLWYARLRDVTAEVERAQADARITRAGVLADVREAYDALLAAAEAAEQVDLLVQRAGEEYRLTLEKYRLGAASSLDLLTSQLARNRAARQAAQILITYRLTRARIELLLGEW